MANKKEISSGAKKAETLAKKKSTATKQSNSGASNAVKDETTTAAKTQKTQRASAAKTPARKNGNTVKSAKNGAKKNKPAKQVNAKKAQRIKAREEKKLRAAEIRAEKKQHKLEKKLEHKQKRLDRIAAMKEKREERREKRRERRDMLRSETKVMRIERKRDEKQAKLEARLAKREAAAAEKQAKREHRLKVRAEKRAERNEKRHAPGFGGWLAAVISLGVTTLALGTILTFGWITMNGMQADMADGQTQSLYELNSVVDNLDTNLSKARVSTSTGDRVRVLTDIAIESEMAEVILERMPLDITMTEEISSFINKMSDSTQDMLYTVAIGGELSPSQVKSLQYMYETNLQIKRALNEIVANAKTEDVIAAMRGKGSVISESFTDIQNNVIQSPKGIQDGPFSDSLKTEGATALDGLEEITAPQAEELAKQYFADFKPTSARCTGEAVANGMTLYNVAVCTDDGEMLAQLSKQGGLVVMFDSYKDCSDKNFDIDRCVTIAEDFLESIGYSGMKAVWSSENGTTCNLNFAPEQNGAVLYPDLIKVKVCEERGLVTGVEAMSYVLNHGDRDLPKASISKEAAQSKINGDIDVSTSRLALIPLHGEEILTYEFFGAMGDNEYYVYVDAQTGEEVEVLTIVGTAQGKALM